MLYFFLSLFFSGEPYPQPFESLCFYQTVKAVAKQKGNGKDKSKVKSKARKKWSVKVQKQLIFVLIILLKFWQSCDSIHILRIYVKEIV